MRPKPLVEVGGMPILWHIFKVYSSFGINDFIVCCGYKGYMIKEYFANYFLHTSDVTFHMDVGNHMEVHQRTTEPWKVTLIDTGDKTETGGRLGRVRSYLDDEPFCFTYGDGVADVDMGALIAQHRQQGLQATLTAVQPPVVMAPYILKTISSLTSRKKPTASRPGSTAASWCLSPASVI